MACAASSSAEIDVEADDAVLESALVAVVVEDRTEQFGIKIFPILKSKLAAEHTGVDVARHEGGFHQNGARSAEGVDEVAVELQPLILIKAAASTSLIGASTVAVR